MTLPTRQEDVGANALATLPSQFEGATNLRKLVQAISGEPGGTRLQQLEDVFWSLFFRFLNDATGQQLEEIRLIVGCPEAFPDRGRQVAAIRLQILINSSQGEPERLITILRLLCTPTGAVHFMAHGMACDVFDVMGPTERTKLDRLKPAVSAGVDVVVKGDITGTPFVFGKDRDETGTEFGDLLPYGSGWCEDGGGTGGAFAEVYYQASET